MFFGNAKSCFRKSAMSSADIHSFESDVASMPVPFSKSLVLKPPGQKLITRDGKSLSYTWRLALNPRIAHFDAP
jgi:hypothetical protein